MYEHGGHNHKLISKVFEQHKAEIVQYLEPILKQRDIYEKALKPVESRIEEIDAKKASVEHEIEWVFAEVVSQMNARKSAILQKLNSIVDAKKRVLLAQKLDTASTLDRVRSCVSFVEGTLRIAHPADVLEMKADVIKSVEELSAHIRAPPLLKPSETATIKFTYSADHLIDTLKDFGKVYTYDACPEKCTVTGDCLEPTTIGETNCGILQTINAHDCLSVEPVEAECELVSDVTGYSVTGKVDNKKNIDSMYDLMYVAAEKGQHKLHVKVEGEHVSGSPFSVAVRSNEPLKEPISAIHKVDSPSGVAVTERGVIFVTQSDSVCVFTLKGERVRSIGSEGSREGQLIDPCGVIQDQHGNIVVVDTGNQRLQKFSAEGKLLKVLDKKTAGFNSPMYIAWNETNTSYYVTDSKNHCVYIVTSDLKSAKSFGEHGPNLEVIMCEDSAGQGSLTAVSVHHPD